MNRARVRPAIALILLGAFCGAVLMAGCGKKEEETAPPPPGPNGPRVQQMTPAGGKGGESGASQAAKPNPN